MAEPRSSVLNDIRDRLDDVDLAWLAASPFCLLSTAGADGSCDASPRGDVPGFALALYGYHARPTGTCG